MKVQLWPALLMTVCAGVQAHDLWIDPPSWLRCRNDAARDCTVANGRADALAMAQKKLYVLFTWGGPATPQEPTRILVEESNRIGIAIWFTGDTIDTHAEAYQNAFNAAMKSAVDAVRGPSVLRDAEARIARRTRAWSAAVEAKRR